MDASADIAPSNDKPLVRRARGTAWVALALLLTGLGLWTLREFLPALVWAAILAVAIWPLYQRTRGRWPPGGARDILLPAAFTAGIALLFVLPLVLTGVQAVKEARALLPWLETVRHTGIPVPEVLARLPVGAAPVTEWWRENLSDPEGAAELVRRARASEFMLMGRHAGLAVAHGIVTFGFCLMTLFFLLKDGDILVRQLRRAGNRAFGPVGERIGRQIIASVHGTVDGLVLVGLGVGVLMGLVYALVGVPHPTLLGGVTAVAAMIPLAAPVVFGLAALLAAANGNLLGAGIVAAAGVVITFVADHFVRPVLIGGATRLPFLWVLLGILGGVATWGLLGLFVGPAIMAALILLWREWTEPSPPP